MPTHNDSHRSSSNRRRRDSASRQAPLPRLPDVQNPGDFSGEATPVTIPNTEVKLSSAEDTERAAFRENRSSPGFLRVWRRDLAGPSDVHDGRSPAAAVDYARSVTVTSEKGSESTEGGPPVRDNRVDLPAAAFATQRLCPYLVADGSEWRSASPSRDHRCGAVAPPVPLAVDKQRRLCLTNRHVGCPTFLAAMDQPGRAVGSVLPDPSARQGRAAAAAPGGETVTRWPIVRTPPVLLDGGRVSSNIATVARIRSQPQLVLVYLIVVAIVAIPA